MCILVVFAVPAVIVLSEQETYIVPNTDGIFVDICLRGREILIFVTAVILALYWLGERIFPDNPLPSSLIHNKRAAALLIICGAYLLFAVLSSVFGIYREVSFLGIASENEGVAAVFGYIILFAASFEYFHTERAIKALDMAIFVMSALINVMFLIERIGTPLIELLFGIFDDRSGTALLFGNSANCGAVCSLLAIAAIGFAYNEQKIVLKYIKASLSGGLILTAITTYSSAAVYGLSIGLIFLAVFIILLKSGSVKGNILFFAAVIVPLIIFFAADTRSALKYISSDFSNSGTYYAENNFDLTDISMQQNELILSGKENSMIIVLEDDNTLVFGDQNGKELCRTAEGKISFDEPFSKISAEVSEKLLTLDLGYADTISFETTEGKFRFIGLNGYLDDELSESAFPELSDYYKFGTGRGYIWLNSIPLLKDSVILGHGAGQFAFYFPQNDIVGMLNTHGSTSLLTDKPHCLYLGVAISYGIPALLLFAALAFAALKSGIGAYIKSPNVVTAGISGSVFCFLIMSIVNDSSPVYSPLFWIFSGILCGNKANRSDKV